MGIDEFDEGKIGRDVVIPDVLDREQREREVEQELNQRLNQPRPDIPMPVPGTLKTEHPRLVRPDQQEIAEMGGQTNYYEYFGGEYEPKAVLTDEEKDEAVRRWKLKFRDEEIPYDLDNEATGMIEYWLMLGDLRRRVLAGMGEPVEGYESKPLDLAEAGVVAEAGLDISKIRNRRIKEVLKRLGGEDFVRDVWTNAEEITLVAPADEGAKWVMQLVGKPGDNGKKKLLAMTLADWERMLVIRDDNGEEREVRLPDPGDGSYEKVLPLVRSLFKLNFRGKCLPRDLRPSREFLRP